MPGRLMRAAATASMVSTARTNRAVRKNIEGQNEQMQQQSAAAPAQDELTQQLQKLANLLDQGLITQDEYDAKKKQLLGL